MGRLLTVVVFFSILILQTSHGYGQPVKPGRHPSPKVNASMMLFFNVEELRVGNKIPFLFPRLERAPNFISRQEADSIPFSSTKLQQLLRFFSIPPKSASAEAVRTTLVTCESPPMKGETKFCPTSKDSMFDFVRRAFVRLGGGGGGGGGGGLEVLGTTHFTDPPPVKTTGRDQHAQNYSILSFKEYAAARAVGCHTTAYPYAVYYCHHFDGGNKVFVTQLEGDEDGERVETAVLCHVDTSTWGPDHPAFLVLGTKPGAPVCHIFPEYDIVFIPEVNVVN